MSKKSKPRRGKAADQAAGGMSQAEAEAFAEQMLTDLWAGIATGDPLRAELETASCMAIPRVIGRLEEEESDAFVASVLIRGAVRKRTPDGAALLRLLMALGTPATRRAASQALAELTGAGIYPPDWVTEIGKAVPGRAWRRYDVLGDEEAIVVTFSYGEAEHGVMVQVDLAGLPVAIGLGVYSDAARLVEIITGEEQEFDRSEQISLAEARRRLLEPLDRCFGNPSPDLSTQTVAYLPVARFRVRRLPAGGSGHAEPGPAFTAADRAAAVDEFMKSPQAAEAVAADEQATRFWAEVLTGYSSRVQGVPPDQVGPRTLAHILLGHVPKTFVLSAAQRDHLEPAVTAWARWSADRRDLGEAATAALMERVPLVISRFGLAYDDPDAAVIRGYASGLAASDADVAQLSDAVGRRMFALPLPEQPGPLDLTDPASRRRLVEAEFAECAPPSGVTGEEFAAAAVRVVEDLWRGETGTYQAARRMFADGTDRHDIIHQLAAAPAPAAGSPAAR